MNQAQPRTGLMGKPEAKKIGTKAPVAKKPAAKEAAAKGADKEAAAKEAAAREATVKKAWRGFEPGLWQRDVNVRWFIQRNYAPYDGDEKFLAPATARTKGIWKKL